MLDIEKLRNDMLMVMHRLKRMDFGKGFGILTRSEFFALEAIQKHCGRAGSPGIYVSELAERLEVSPPAVSRMLRGMEQNGWIERRVDVTDRRNTLVTATPLGKEKTTQTKALLDGIADHVACAVGEQDMHQLTTLLSKVADALEAELKTKQEEKAND